MTKSLAALLFATAGVAAASTLESLRLFPVSERQNVQNLLLKGATSSVVENGKTRILIPLDDAMYEVIIATPGAPRLIPARR